MGIKFTPERALIVGRTAVIADLHLGLENVLIEKGIAIPKVQLDEILERLDRVSKEVERVVIAGDLKHEFGKNLPYEWEDVKAVIDFLLSKDLEVVVVRGNHDNFLKAILAKFGIDLLDHYDVEGWRIVHGHKACDADKIIMGHEHPAIKVRVDGVYTFHCFLRVRKDGREIIVLPAFSPLVQGSDVTSCEFISPILAEVDCEEVEVYAVNDEVLYLGTIADIKNLKIHQPF
ncbi:metallophosphoesterase [Archaeoglobus profundus]|uniref:Phosphoesterase n=1 Tax=Archaeoglobus profundus (strain DSM 5631 / JCM 9629 / NBRC 100127 / Av18) TaxID=572546 RepID=D2RGC5_ARCPA|nr:metallophosphoesterase [Archaeoglobus profundus]ADB57350.1 phosphoesterase [Archaeoglobus profundus DSM 5631]